MYVLAKMVRRATGKRGTCDMGTAWTVHWGLRIGVYEAD
jgi:hypothetical protein